MGVLVLEASTTSAKAMVYEPGAGVVRLCTKRYGPEAGDAFYHYADGALALLLALGREAAAGAPVDAVALVGTWHTMLCCRRDMSPEFPVYLWTSLAGTAYADRVRKDPELADRLYKTTGCMPHALYPLYNACYLRRGGQARGDELFTTEDAYFYYKLTGAWRTSQSMMSGSGLLDVHRLEYAGLALNVANITEEQLPELCDHRFTRPLCKEAAALLGQKSGIPVCVAHPDGAMNQLGCSALKPGRMTLSVGTSAAMRLTADNPDTAHLCGNWFYYAPGHWLEGASAGATNNIDWFMNNLASGKSFSDLETDIQPDSPVYLPFLYGEGCPGWNDRNTARFAELRARHTAADLYAAVQEGILHGLYQCYCNLCRAHGTPERVLLSGGILKSARWSQMAADLFGRDMEISRQEQASMLGGAAVALLALGEISSLEDFAGGPEGKPLYPNEEKRKLYRQRHEKYLYHYDQQR